jgi:hypothetical protein
MLGRSVFLPLLRQITVAPALVIIATALVPSLALADPEPVRITYEAHGACPSERSFIEDVEARTALAHQPKGRETRQFIVIVQGEEGQSRGRLEIRDQLGSVVTREVVGESCAEVASALALITALAIDPQASTAARAPLVAEPATPSALTPSAPSPLPPARAAEPPASVFAPQASGPRLAVDQPGRPATWRWSTGIQGLALLGLVPTPAFGGAVFADLGPTGRWHVWPAFRLAVAYAATERWTAATGVGIRWQWAFARLEACPASLRPGERYVDLSLCVAVDAGAITSRGASLSKPTTQTRPWVAPGLEVRASWGPPAGLFVDLGAELSRPVWRWIYRYQDRNGVQQDICTTSALGAVVALGVGYRWP